MAHNLSGEYDATKTALDTGGFDDDKDAKALISLVKKAVGVDGFDPTQSETLEKLRSRLLKGSGVLGAFGVGANEGKRTLQMAKAIDAEKYSGTDAAIKRAAALKMLRHTYMLSTAGAKSIWVVNIPKSYRDWPSLELPPLAAHERNLTDRINKSGEYFSSVHKKNMVSGTCDAMKWVQRTLTVLSNYGKDKGASAIFVKRWFETIDTSASDLTAIVDKLTTGFKKIQATLNSNQLIFSDYPPDRGTSDENSEAFVFNGAWKDRLKIVYIEKGFFQRGGNVLSGRDNWARIIVHELSHSQVDTEDYPPDNSYGWQGINPKAAKYNGNTAIRNAENWAFFAADCGGGLNLSERSTALKTD